MTRSVLSRLPDHVQQQIRSQLGASSTNKYRNQPLTVDGIRFASKGEAKRFQELRMLERAGQITDLRPHPRYELVVNGTRIGVYTADAEYRQNGHTIIEDYKSPATLTQVSRLRIKLFTALTGKAVAFVGV